MISTEQKIGFVKYGPGPLHEVNWFGGKFQVWPQQVAIVDILRRGRHEARVFGPGIHSVDKTWFADQATQLTILSTGEEHFQIHESFDHEVNFRQPANPKVAVTVPATVRFRLVSREDELQAAMDRLLERDPEKLANLEGNLRQYVRNAFQEIVRRSHLLILRQSPRAVEDEVKRYLDSDGRARRDLAIAIIAIQLGEGFAISPMPTPPAPVAEFIKYRGPLDLAPNCQLVAGGLAPELKFDVLSEEAALVQGDRQPVLRPGQHDMQREPLNDPQREVIVLSLAKFDLPFTTEFSRFFEFEDGTRGETARSPQAVRAVRSPPPPAGRALRRGRERARAGTAAFAPRRGC